MLDICLLGCGGMMPLPYRYLTSMMARYNGNNILIDCGEGTQIALREKGWSPNPIGIICFTHFHADHISGLPGMLLTMGNAERKEPLLLIGPKGLEKTVKALLTIAPELPFSIEYRELNEKQECLEFGDLLIHAFRVQHNIVCYGYSIEIKRKGRFDAQAAKEQNIPLKCWNKLQHGETVSMDGMVYTPDMVMGADRRGLKVTYTTDTRPTQSIVENAKGSDLFICEGMYGEAEMITKAKSHKHMTFLEAAELAAQADGVKELWLTHYSPSLPKPEPYMKEVRKIFENAYPGKDGKTVTLLFDED